MDSQNPSSKPPKDSGVMDQVALMSYIDDVIAERKDPRITQEALPNVRMALLKQLNDDINYHLVNLLSEKDQVELDMLLDTNPTDDAVNDYMEKHIPNLDAEIAAVLLNFRTAFLYQPETTGDGGVPKAQEDIPPSAEPSRTELTALTVPEPTAIAVVEPQSKALVVEEHIAPAPLPPEPVAVKPDFGVLPPPPMPAPVMPEPSSKLVN